MSLILKLEAMAGDGIGDTCYEMVSIAKRLNLCVQVKFNDVTLMSYRGGCPEQLAREYADKVGSNDKYKYASTRG